MNELRAPLNALRAFDAAARHMSFQKAANELHVTPAALSYQIRQLEESLEVKLFHRLNRSVSLTEHGELIRPGVREAFERLSETLRRLQRSRTNNVLTVSAGPAFTAKWLAPRLYRFIVRHPEIDARVSASLSLADLELDDVDFAIRFGAGEYPGCCSIKLMDEYVTPMCTPALMTGDRPIREPADLAHHALIHDETHKGIFELAEWSTWLTAAGAPEVNVTRQGLHFNVADHALDAAVAGAGVVLGRLTLAQSDLAAGRLVAPFELKLKARWSFYAVCLETRVDEPAIAAFRNWCLDEAAGREDVAAAGPPV